MFAWLMFAARLHLFLHGLVSLLPGSSAASRSLSPQVQATICMSQSCIGPRPGLVPIHQAVHWSTAASALHLQAISALHVSRTRQQDVKHQPQQDARQSCIA